MTIPLPATALFAMLLCLTADLHAQATAPFVVEGGGNYHDLTGPYSAWAGAYIRLIARPNRSETWNIEILRRRQFDDTGTYISLADTITINDDWYVDAAAATSAGGFFFPKFRADAQINKKWSEKRNLVTSIGVGYFKAKDAHHDSSLFAGGVYYFDRPWVVQGGVRWNRSSPGSVISRSQFIAVSQGRDGEHFLVFRLGFGREAWQAIEPGVAIVDFASHSLSGTWRQWLGPSWGIHTSVEYYSGAAYRRTGTSVGFFKAF